MPGLYPEFMFGGGPYIIGYDVDTATPERFSFPRLITGAIVTHLLWGISTNASTNVPGIRIGLFSHPPQTDAAFDAGMPLHRNFPGDLGFTDEIGFQGGLNYGFVRLPLWLRIPSAQNIIGVRLNVSAGDARGFLGLDFHLPGGQQ